MQVVFENVGASNPDGILTTQGSCWLEQLVDGQWTALPVLIGREAEPIVLFTTPNGAVPVTLDYDWADTYGALEPGYYRLAQTVVLKHSSDHHSKTVYAKFQLLPETV